MRISVVYRILVVFLSVAFSGTAQAGPIFASAWAGAYTSYSFNPDGMNKTSDPTSWPGDVVSSSTVGSQTATAVNPGGTNGGATVSSSASANLAQGQLHASESAVLAPGATASNARAEALASFGDSFSVFGPSGPFSWTSSTTVLFSITVNGHINPNPGVDQFFYVEFGYGLPGALANSGSGVGNEFPAGMTAGGFYTTDFCFIGVGYSENNSGLATCGGLLTMNSAGDVSGTVTVQFAPNGNFDWFAGLDTVGWPGSYPAGPGSSVMNFSDTVGITYTGPDGTTTYSASGVFPGTEPLASPVPEPTSLLLLGTGLVGLLARRKRRS